uniref:nuclear envelope integral membrane protein 1-like n=1 Tax=Myxine glutinosa TaxID=7769 RepID=UPI00358F585F
METIFLGSWLLYAAVFQVVSASEVDIEYVNIGYSSHRSTPRTFCHNPGEFSARDLWATAHVRISSQVRVMVTMDVGGMEVSQHDQSWLGWFSNLRSSTHQSISLDLFEQTCFCVECAKTYVVTVVHTRYDLWLIGCLVLGLLLVVYADYLSKSAIFLSTSGFFLGVLSSLLIIFVLCCLLPAQIPLLSFIAQIIVLSVKFFHSPPEDFLWFYRECRQRWWSIPLPEVLGETEYQLQANRETRRGLQDLRHHCQSPEVDAWEIRRKLNSPSRFANFVRGSDHVSPEEIYAHRREFHS